MAFFLPMAGLGLAAIILKMIVAKLPFLEIHPFLEVLPVLYGAMRMRGAAPFYLAIFLGAVVDILSPQKFGTGPFVLCLVPAVVWTQRENLRFDRLGTALVLALVATFLASAADYLLFCWESSSWDWRFGTWVRLAWMALLNMILAAPFFWISDLLLVRLWRGKIAPGGQVREEGKSTLPPYAL